LIAPLTLIRLRELKFFVRSRNRKF